MAIPGALNTHLLGKIGGTLKAIHESVASENIGQASITLSSASPAVGKLWEITDLSYFYGGTVSGVRLELKANDITILKTVADPTSSEYVRELTSFYLNQGEKIDLIVTGATLEEDVLRFTYRGLQTNTN